MSRVKKTPSVAKTHNSTGKSGKETNPPQCLAITRHEMELMWELPTFSEKSDAEVKNLLALVEDFAAKLKEAKANKVKAEDPQRIRLEQLLKLAQGRYKVASDIGCWFHDVGDVFEEHRKSGASAELAEPMLKMARSADKIVRLHGVSEAFQPDSESESS
ncbi:hypothetical protein CPB97_006226 [Podila verticillata]|nr:hypothetical protein CPB97_006226 [Podila verticillata]